MFANIEGAYPFMQIQLPPDFQIVGTPLISYTLKLYEPSFSKQGSRVKAKLGLFTCYNIVQKHRGQITVKSEIGKGTTFTIIIPTNLEQEIENAENPVLGSNAI